MKYMIASDIHGSARWCRQTLAAFDREGADRLVLLGDLLYHGPRNDLPDEYAPKQVLAMLNERREKLLCVRGNCDTEVDQMVLTFPMMADYAVLPVGERLMYMTHGHHFGESCPPPMMPGDLLLCGHTHVPACNVHEDFVYLNPGSTSIPKENSPHGYMTLTDGLFQWKQLADGSVWKEWRAD